MRMESRGNRCNSRTGRREAPPGGGADARAARSCLLPASPVFRAGSAVAEAALTEDVSRVSGVVADLVAEPADGLRGGPPHAVAVKLGSLLTDP